MPSITYNRFEGGLDLRQGTSVADANRLRVLKNAYVTTGRAIKKRPGLVQYFDLSSGDILAPSIGLFAAKGRLNTFGQYANTYTNPIFQCHEVSAPTGAIPEPTTIHFADTYTDATAGTSSIFVVVEYDDNDIFYHYLNGDPFQMVQPTDATCPKTKQVTKVGSKLYAVGDDGEIVRFCATGAPKDWTTAHDAGFINIADQRANSGLGTALGAYNKKLAVFSADCLQVWTVDADPANNALSDVLDIGTNFSYAHANLGGDTFFVSRHGIRSVAQNATVSGNLQEFDIGSPIDSIINTVFSGNEPKSFYYRSAGQFWIYYQNKALVYTFSRTSKISAWSIYEFAVPIEYAAELDAELYVRSGDIVYKLSDTAYTDNGTPIVVDIELPFLDFKSPGVLKQLLSMDVVFSGTADIQHRFDAFDQSQITTTLSLSGDSRARRLIPIELLAVSIAPVITHNADEPFELQALTYYYESLGIVP